MRSRAIASTPENKADEDAIDRALLAASASGDAEAFERLYRRHYRRLFDFAARLSGSHDAADEVASEALKVAWRRAGDFEGRSKVTTWLFGVAYRLTLKARARMSKRAGDVAYDDDVHAPRSAGDEVEAAFLRSQVARALAALSPEHRTVVELTYYQGLRYSEIAEIIDRPIGTVKTRMLHARARLRELMSTSDGR